MNDEGPTRLTIPARVTLRCGCCKFHNLTGALYTRIGPGGWREYSCTHPKAWPEVDDGDVRRAEFRGMLRATEDGRDIGRTEETPHWCPYLREKS